MNAQENAMAMIEAQRAAFNALASSKPIFNTVGSADIHLIEEQAAANAAAKIQNLSVFEQADRRAANPAENKRINNAIPENKRLRATYTPIVMRELVLWICWQTAKLLKYSNVMDCRKFAKQLSEDARDYDHIWEYEYDNQTRQSIVYLMKNLVCYSGFDKHITNLKNAYLYAINNGSGNRAGVMFKDPNARDLIAWQLTSCALCDETIRFDAYMIAEINKHLKSINSKIVHKDKKDDFSYIFRSYPESILQKFGYSDSLSCSQVTLARKVIQTQMRLYDPQPKVYEYNKLIAIEEKLANKK